MAKGHAKGDNPHPILRGFSYALAGVFAAGLFVTVFQTLNMLLGA